MNAVADLDTAFSGARFAICFLDIGTGWREAAPDASRNTTAAVKAFHQFAGQDEIKSFYSDNAGELTKAADQLGWTNPTSTPTDSQSNGIAERNVQHIEQLTRTSLEHSGMPKGTWDYAMRHGCLAENFIVRNGESCYQKRHTKGHFKGALVPFGARVDFLAPKNLQKKLSMWDPRGCQGSS